MINTIADEYELKYRDISLYTGTCVLPLACSTGWHTDNGLGLLLNWLIGLRDIDGFVDLARPQLVTRNTVLDLEVGDIFVFNANVGHAWISNSACLLVQMPVSVKKSSVISY